MTIIKPTIQKKYMQFFALLVITIFLGGVFYVFEYNSFVNARYQVTALNNKIATAETQNTQLKNAYYTMTDPTHLDALVPQYNLTLARQPQYLTQSKWVSDSSY